MGIVKPRPALWTGALLFAYLSACARPTSQLPGEPEFQFEDRPATTGLPRALVLTPYSQSTHEFWRTMRNEVDGEIDILTVQMTPDVDVQLLQEHITAQSPQCVVLVGNQAVRVFRQLQASGRPTPPAIVAMSSFAKELTAGMSNTSGVSYEVPALSSIVALRQISRRAIHRVGVLYRPSFESLVKNEAELARVENVELVSLAMDGSLGSRSIRLALRELLRKEKVDALWVLNDNALLEPSNIRDGWLPEARSSEVPVVVGVRNLVNPQLSFGSLAVVPDHPGLGVQVANLLFDLSDEDWKMDSSRIELPLSVRTVVDMSQGHVLQLAPKSADFIDEPLSSFRSGRLL